MLRKNGTFWEKPGYFWEKSFIYLCILPFTLVFALSFATWTFREKNGTFWETSEKKNENNLGTFEKNPGIFEKNPGTFEKHMGPTRTLGEPFVKNPTDLVPLFARLSKCENFWEMSESILDGILLTHTQKCHWPAKHQHSNQVPSDSLPSASGDVTSGTQKMLKKGICKRHLVKWQVASGSFKEVYLSQIVSNVSKKSGNIFFLTFGEC